MSEKEGPANGRDAIPESTEQPAREAEQHLSEWMEDLQARQAIAPEAQRQLEFAKWRVGATQIIDQHSTIGMFDLGLRINE